MLIFLTKREEENSLKILKKRTEEVSVRDDVIGRFHKYF